MTKNLHWVPSVCLLLLIACKDAKTKHGPEADDDGPLYYIDAPTGWTKQNATGMGADATLLMSPLEENDSFRENINVLVENTGNIERETYITKSDEILMNGLTDFVLDKKSDRTINGMNFSYRKFSHSYNGSKVDTEGYCVVDDGKAYIITCSAQGGTLDKWAADFDGAIQSFRLK